jgi:hypothetical protein
MGGGVLYVEHQLTSVRFLPNNRSRHVITHSEEDGKGSDAQKHSLKTL